MNINKNTLHGKNHGQQSKNQMSNQEKLYFISRIASLPCKESLGIDKTKTNNPRGKYAQNMNREFTVKEIHMALNIWKELNLILFFTNHWRISESLTTHRLVSENRNSHPLLMQSYIGVASFRKSIQKIHISALATSLLGIYHKSTLSQVWNMYSLQQKIRNNLNTHQ